MRTLSDLELHEALATLPHWHLLEGKLIRNFEFPGFAPAVAYVNRVAHLAEQKNHHPDIEIHFNMVRLSLMSHDANGITRRDATLATLIDALDL